MIQRHVRHSHCVAFCVDSDVRRLARQFDGAVVHPINHEVQAGIHLACDDDRVPDNFNAVVIATADEFSY